MNNIDFFGVALAANTIVRICTPRHMNEVPRSFWARGTSTASTTTSPVSCTLDWAGPPPPPPPPPSFPMTLPAIPVGTNGWEVHFPDIPEGNYTLVASNGSADSDLIRITVRASAIDPEWACFEGEKGDLSETELAIDFLRVPRNFEADPALPAASVRTTEPQLRGFETGGELDPGVDVVECFLDGIAADSVQVEQGRWSASFSNVPFSTYTLLAQFGDGTADQVTVLIGMLQ